MSEEDTARFVREGMVRLTDLNAAIQRLDAWADAFVQRGGLVAFGNDAALITGINEKVQGAITETDRATVARLRTDV